MQQYINFNDNFSYKMTSKGFDVYAERMNEFQISVDNVFYQKQQEDSLGNIIFNFGKAISEFQKDLFVDNMFYQNEIPFDFLNSSCDIVFASDAYEIFNLSSQQKSQKMHLSFQKICSLLYKQLYLGNPKQIIHDFSANFYFPHFQLINSFQKPIVSNETKKLKI